MPSASFVRFDCSLETLYLCHCTACWLSRDNLDSLDIVRLFHHQQPLDAGSHLVLSMESDRLYIYTGSCLATLGAGAIAQDIEALLEFVDIIGAELAR